MSRIEWDKIGEHFYEVGVSKGVLYESDSSGEYTNGVGWNGLSGVSENPSGGDTTPIYANNNKYLSLVSAEDYGFTIEAYTWPDEWYKHIGKACPIPGLMLGQQKRKPFGFCYRTEVGNDTQGDSYGYKLHMVYGCTAGPSEEGHSTISDSPEVNPFSWECSTVPIPVRTLDQNGHNYRFTATFTIDTTKLTAAAKIVLKQLEDILYGTINTVPHMPLPDDIISMFLNGGILTYYGYVASNVTEPTATMIKALNHVNVGNKGYTYENISMPYNKIVYAYPKSYGALTSIVDANAGWIYNDTFSVTEIAIDGVDYYVYVMTDPCCVDQDTPINLKFS